MSAHDRLLSLAAGTVRDAPRCDAIDAGAAAGFGAVGLRFDLDAPDRAIAELERLHAEIAGGTEDSPA